MIEYIKQQLRKFRYYAIKQELIREGYEAKDILSFEQMESLRGHRCSYILKKEPEDLKFSDFYICDNNLCKHLKPKKNVDTTTN